MQNSKKIKTQTTMQVGKGIYSKSFDANHRYPRSSDILYGIAIGLMTNAL